MKRTIRILSFMMIAMIFTTYGCSNKTRKGEHQNSESVEKSTGEHDRGDGEHNRDRQEGHNEEGEESGMELGLTEVYDQVRNGVRLILAYDAKNNSFNGTVENVANKVLKRVRVEVHLSNGKELGPTAPVDLAVGKKREVKLSAVSKDFDAWTAHPEVGNNEHGHTGEKHGKHREGDKG